MEISDVVRFIQKCSREDLYTVRRTAQGRITDLNNAKGTTSKVVKYDDFAMELAETLWKTVRVNYPFMPEPNLSHWAADITRIHSVDNVPVEIIKAALLWSQQDDFWKMNIRSGSALRRNFQKVYGSAMQKGKQLQSGRIHKV